MPNHSIRYVSLAALVLTLATGCQKKEPVAPTEVEVQTTVARNEPITEHIATDGILTPLAQAAISPRISAPVKEFFVQRGSKVRKGELLATLENRDLAAAVVDSQGSYDAARA
ncbi:MAG: biotin/lipoyl-binding protein, partial [Silvibacterium sp.]